MYIYIYTYAIIRLVFVHVLAFLYTLSLCLSVCIYIYRYTYNMRYVKIIHIYIYIYMHIHLSNHMILYRTRKTWDARLPEGSFPILGRSHTRLWSRKFRRRLVPQSGQHVHDPHNEGRRQVCHRAWQGAATSRRISIVLRSVQHRVPTSLRLVWQANG